MGFLVSVYFDDWPFDALVFFACYVCESCSCLFLLFFSYFTPVLFRRLPLSPLSPLSLYHVWGKGRKGGWFLVRRTKAGDLWMRTVSLEGEKYKSAERASDSLKVEAMASLEEGSFSRFYLHVLLNIHYRFICCVWWMKSCIWDDSAKEVVQQSSLRAMVSILICYSRSGVDSTLKYLAEAGHGFTFAGR